MVCFDRIFTSYPLLALLNFCLLDYVGTEIADIKSLGGVIRIWDVKVGSVPCRGTFRNHFRSWDELEEAQA